MSETQSTPELKAHFGFVRVNLENPEFDCISIMGSSFLLTPKMASTVINNLTQAIEWAKAHHKDMPAPTNYGEALNRYRSGMMSKDELCPHWVSELERVFGSNIEPERMHQVYPLFENGWSPMDASDHLNRVWALKRWEKSPS